MRIVYLNGSYVPESEAKISVFDRGLLFGDSVYEVIPLYHGVGFRFEEHVQRLRNGLLSLRIELELDVDRICRELWERNGRGHQSVYLQVTRGVAEQRSLLCPVGILPTVMAFTQPIPAALSEGFEGVNGIAAITLDDERWRRCDIKATTLLPNILAIQQALDAGAQEALMVRDGYLTEGTSCNLFVVRSGVIYTPEKGNFILGGTTREVLVALAESANLPLREVPVPQAWLEDAEEIWISSSTRGVVPVVKLNGSPVGTGRIGPLWQRMARLFGDYQRQVLAPPAESSV